MLKEKCLLFIGEDKNSGINILDKIKGFNLNIVTAFNYNGDTNEGENIFHLGDVFGGFRKINILPTKGNLAFISTSKKIDIGLLKDGNIGIITLTEYEKNIIKEIIDLNNNGILALEQLSKDKKTLEDLMETKSEPENIALAKANLSKSKETYSKDRITVTRVANMISFSYGLSRIISRGDILSYNGNDLVVRFNSNKNGGITREMIDKFISDIEEGYSNHSLTDMINIFLLKDIEDNIVEFKYNTIPFKSTDMSLFNSEEVISVDAFDSIDMGAPEALSPVKNSLISSIIATCSNGSEGILSIKEGYSFLYKAAMIPISERKQIKVDGKSIDVRENYWKPYVGEFSMDFKEFEILK